MICENCHAEIRNDVKFCGQCGADTSNMSKVPVGFKKIFIDSNEKNISVLGSSFLRNFLTTQELSKAFCLLSDKRVYFKGKCYKREGGKFIKTIEESTVDLKNITASGFSETKKIGFLVSGVLFFVTSLIFLILLLGVDDDFLFGLIISGILSLIMFIAYAFSKIRLFFIAFAGGGISFKASDYSVNELQEFNRALRITIDNYYKTTEVRYEK